MTAVAVERPEYVMLGAEDVLGHGMAHAQEKHATLVAQFGSHSLTARLYAAGMEQGAALLIAAKEESA